MEITRKHNLWTKIFSPFLFCQIIFFLNLFFSCAFMDLQGLISFEKQITSFSFQAAKNGGVLTCDVNGNVNTDTINITVPYGTSLHLTPTIVIKGKTVNPGNEVAQTFTDGVSIPYTVTGDDNSQKDYLVTVNVALCDAKDITAFAFLQSQNPLLPGDIAGIVSGTDISVTVPPGTDTSSLVPTISITGVSLEPGNNTAQSFPDGTGVPYTVTAADHSTQVYTVTVCKSPLPGYSGALSCISVTTDSITAEWTKATDNISLQSDLQYLLYYSTSGNLTDVTDIEANGIPAGTYTADINTAYLSGLTENTTYYFNVIVKDTTGNKTAYVMNSRITLPETVTVGGTTGTIVTPPAIENAMGITSYGTDLYVTTWTRNTVIRIDKTTGTPTVVAGLDGVSGSADGTGTAARFNQPSGICTDGTNLYVCDTSNGSIRKIVMATGVVTTVATGLQTPYGITTDGTSLYVTNYLKHTIVKIVIETGIKTIFAGTDGSSGTADGIGTAAKLSYPWGICTDGVYLYAVDYVGARVRKVNINTAEVTTITTAVGNARGITTDGVNLYVCSYSSNQVNKVVIATGVVSGVTGAITTPHYIATDGIKLYVTDETNFYIRSIE